MTPCCQPVFLPETLKDWIELAVAVIGVLTALLSVWKYFRNSKEARVKWLSEVYQRFYGNPTMRLVRMRLDSEGGAFVRAFMEEDNIALRGQADDYLNFFEFVSYLYAQKQLGREEIMTMFREPLRDIAKHPEITQRLSGWGFEKLVGMLEGLGLASNLPRRSPDE
jgi:hypothetical protein